MTILDDIRTGPRIPRSMVRAWINKAKEYRSKSDLSFATVMRYVRAAIARRESP